ncbi:endonuclease IV [Sulfolobales archaeon HS-7]|nr:endonuclease IV [Sulfolobales archaeon HS-7]
MTKIYLGPAGIPLSTEKKSTVNGIKKVKELGLNAMEIEFVRGVNMSEKGAIEAGEIASQLGVRLSAHAPYYINLCAEEKEKMEASKNRIFDTAHRLELMGGDTIAIHTAFYGKRTPEECYEIIKQNMLEITDRMKDSGIKRVKLGVETMAKETAFGTLEEVVKLSKEVPRVVPYIDWAHTFARLGGKINYGEVLDYVIKETGITHINSHFESLVFRKGKYVDVHKSIDDNAPPFEPLAKELIKRDISITLICESPLLEEDALKMKKVLEDLGYSLS